jgi:hypothetical protein
MRKTLLEIMFEIMPDTILPMLPDFHKTDYVI